MSGAVVNLDSFFPPAWSERFGDRIFQFDAFISHNWKDPDSEVLLTRLKERGVAAWHDRQQDIRDRLVLQKISRALNNSRMIVVSVGPTFQATPWCRAEYLNGLALEKHTRATRVIVAAATESTMIPPELESAPRFVCSQAKAFEDMIHFLREQNRLPFDFPRTVVQGPLLRTDEVNRLLIESTERLERKEPNGQQNIPLKDLVLRALALTLKELSSEFSNRLFAIRNVLIQDLAREAEWPFTEDEARFIESAALFWADSSNLDNRANAFMVLICLDEQGRLPSGHRTVLKALSHEKDSAVLKHAYSWIGKKMGCFTPHDWNSVFLAVLRSPSDFRYCTSSEVMAMLPDALRTRALVSNCVSTDLLSLPEKLHLLMERAEYILSAKRTIASEDSVDLLRQVTGIPDIELVLREFHDLMIGEYSDAPRELGFERVRVYEAFVSICGQFAAKAQEPPHAGMLEMEDWILDYALIPLLLCSTETTLREPARACYLSICGAVERFGRHAREVPCYRRALQNFSAFTGRSAVGRLFELG